MISILYVPFPGVELCNSVLIASSVIITLPADITGPLVEGGVGVERDV